MTNATMWNGPELSLRNIEFYVDVFEDKQKDGTLTSYLVATSARMKMRPESAEKNYKEMVIALEKVGYDIETFTRSFSEGFDF